MVPPAARGFTLEVGDAKIVDLGTEFGVAVTPDSESIEVFDGEVALHAPAIQQRLLHSGEAVVRTARGSYEDAGASPDAFVGITELEERADAERTADYERWRSWSDDLRHDPRLVCYYSFNQPGAWRRRCRAARSRRIEISTAPS